MKRLLLIPVLLCAISAKGYAYDSKAVYSADQLFDNSLQDLREAMQKAKQSNEDFKEQNRLLKEDVLELEAAVSSAQSEKIVSEAAAAADDSLSDEALAQKEQKLYRSRLENLEARLARVSGQKERLENKVDLYGKENQETKEKIALLKKEVADIQMALNSQQAPTAADGKSAMLAKQLASKKDQIQTLEKKLALQKQDMKGPLAQKEKYSSANASLEDKLASGREELARLQSAQKLLGKPEKTLDLSASQSSMTRQEINDLEHYRDQLRLSLNDLKKAAASVKAPSAADLEKILKTYKEQQALLHQRMDAVRPGSSLLARKDNVMAEKKRLQDQIALAEKGADGSMVSASDLAKIQERISELKKQISAVKNSSPLQKRYEDLTGQVAVLAQDLQNLREHPQEALLQDPQEVKNEIAELEARRVVLAKSVQEIYQKYNLKELPAEDLASKETQLKQYFETLRVENTALQQKLLTLQMRQDKSLPSVQ